MLLVAIKPTTVDYLHLKIIIYADDIKLASDLKQSARFFFEFLSSLEEYLYIFHCGLDRCDESRRRGIITYLLAHHKKLYDI